MMPFSPCFASKVPHKLGAISWRKWPLDTGMPVPGCSRPLLPGQVLPHVVTICGVGISPNSVSCSQRSFFDVCFVADGVEVQVALGHWC